MDIILAVYLLLIILSCRMKERGREDYLSVDNTLTLRGIAAIGIILHHLAEKIHSGIVFGWMVIAGYLLVSFFFFLSGYGLLAQYRKKKDAYLQAFLRKRVLYLLIIYLLDIALHSLADALLGQPHSIREIILSIFVSGVARNSWYMIVLIVCYLLFWLVFSLFKNQSEGFRIGVVFLVQSAFVAYCLACDVAPMWYYSNYGFVAGMLYCKYRDSIDQRLAKHYAARFAGVALFYSVFFFVPPLVERLGGWKYEFYLRNFCRLISSPTAAVLVALFAYGFHPASWYWKKLGELSMEIYLLHGLVHTVLRSNLVYVKSDVLWSIFTIVLAILCALPAHWMNKQIAARVKR